MADISIRISHTYAQAEARRRAESALARISKTYGIRGTWNGSVFNVSAPAKGTFTVAEKTLAVELDLGILLRSIKGKIDAGIREEIARAVE
jgi:putative polyhydroxyalkanoate system protein